MTETKLELIVRGGTVVLKDTVHVMDIGIADGRIVQMGQLSEGAAEELDAEGMLVLAGMVDAHVHLNEPGLGGWEGFVTGSAALAAGGCTTYMDMPLNGIPPTVTVSALQEKLRCADGQSAVDYAVWGGLVPGKLDHIWPLHEAGVCGFKAFMSSPGDPSEEAFREVDDVTLLEGMRRIVKTGKVLALHAESEPLVQGLTQRIRQEGRASPDDYAASRPVLAELEAIRRALFYAERTGCAVHFVHVSCAEGVMTIQQAKEQGLDVSVETCPHYLALDEYAMKTKGAAAKCAPPLRSGEEREKLWEVLGEGYIDIIASDHSPCPEHMKQAEDYFEAWGGISGAQSSMEVIIGEGHVKRGLPLPMLSRMLSYYPAKRFGLHPRKGEIAIGADADLVVIDIREGYVLDSGMLLQRHKMSPYVGERMRCKVKNVLVRGRRVYEYGKGLLDSRSGQWLKTGSSRGTEELIL